MGLMRTSFEATLTALEPSCVRIAVIVGKGRGVVATRAVRCGALIESAPVVVVACDQVAALSGTVLEHYVYDWADGVAIALGSGSIYNHSYTPNAIYTRRMLTSTLEYSALRDIAEGEEVLINYNGDPNDRTPLWFTVV